MLLYKVYIDDVFQKNVTEPTVTFNALTELPEEAFLGNVRLTVRPVNRFGEGPVDNVTAEISKLF